MTDEQLVKKCLKHDALAQKLLFDRFSGKMMGVCLRYFSSSEEAEDALQMGFIKVFDKLDKFDNRGSLEGWVRRIMVNTALDAIRKNKKFEDNISIDKVDYQMKSSIEDGVDILSAKDLLGLIQSIPLGYRTVFNMFALEGYSHQEIAKELNISEGTSKSQYARARAYIKNKLEQLKTHQ